MAKLRFRIFGSKTGVAAGDMAMASKVISRPLSGDGYVRVKVPGAGEVRLDLKKHIESSLKSTSDALNGKYKFSGSNGKKRA